MMLRTDFNKTAFSVDQPGIMFHKDDDAYRNHCENNVNWNVSLHRTQLSEMAVELQQEQHKWITFIKCHHKYHTEKHSLKIC